MTRPAAILTDIEGTTTPISFVRDTLFPYARERLAGYLAAHGGDAEMAALVSEVSALAPDRSVQEALLGWMDADAKVTPLKALQGLIWDEGYRQGVLQGAIYADVPPVLRRWHAQGIGLHVYSSGSEAAQRLIFGYSQWGDLAGLFGGFYDTRWGAKREAASYGAIAADIGLSPARILFLSDQAAELDAAAESGMAVCQLVRGQDGTVACLAHPTAADYEAVDGIFAL